MEKKELRLLMSQKTYNRLGGIARELKLDCIHDLVRSCLTLIGALLVLKRSGKEIYIVAREEGVMDTYINFPSLTSVPPGNSVEVYPITPAEFERSWKPLLH